MDSHHPDFYQAGKRRTGCFPFTSHGRPLLAQVASNRLRKGVSLPCVPLFRGYYNSYDHVQVSGLNQHLNEQGQLPNPMVWLMTHTREPDDGMLMGALHGVLPLAADGRGGHRLLPRFVMRKSASVLEVFSKFLGIGWFSVNVATADKQNAGDKQANAVVLRELNGQLAQGDHPHIFAEAKIRGEGIVQVPGSCGAAYKCREVVKPARGIFRRRPALQKPVPMLPVALTYEFYGRDKPVAMFSAGPTFVVTGKGPEMARDIERVLARNNTLSMSGILGAFLLDCLNPAGATLVDGAALARVQLSAEIIEDLVTHCLEALHAAQRTDVPLALNEVAVDRDLLDAGKRKAMARRTFQQLQEVTPFVTARRRLELDTSQQLQLPVCDAHGFVNAAAVGPRADLDNPTPFKDQHPHVYSEQPLRYWGNRVRQQCRAMPELQAVLRRAYEKTLATR